MYTAFALGMSRATELTLSGRLDGATAQIWSLFLIQPGSATTASQGADPGPVAHI